MWSKPYLMYLWWGTHGVSHQNGCLVVTALNCAHGLLYCAHGLLYRAHGLLYRAHGLLYCAHGLLYCAHGLLYRAHGLLYCAHGLRIMIISKFNFFSSSGHPGNKPNADSMPVHHLQRRTRRSPNADTMLGQRRRRWANTATTLGER